eukprot:2673425-Amphidinium_carterae.3
MDRSGNEKLVHGTEVVPAGARVRSWPGLRPAGEVSDCLPSSLAVALPPRRPLALDACCLNADARWLTSSRTRRSEDGGVKCQVPVLQKVQKIAEVPQTQIVERMVDVQCQVPVMLMVQEQPRCHRHRTWREFGNDYY